MEQGRNFDLNRAIAQWRTRLTLRKDLAGQDIEEMESHLRDEIDDLISEGKDERESFYQASGEFGQEEDLVERFNAANWEKAAVTRTIRSPILVGNHLKLAWRSATKKKGYTTINLIGVAVGISSFLLATLYVTDELSYDRFHAGADRIYRIVVDHAGPDGANVPRISTPGALADAARLEIPEVEAVTQAHGSFWGKVYISDGSERWYYDDHVVFVDEAFFDFFSFTFIDGDRKSAMDDPRSIVLTERFANQFFESGEALGKTLIYNNRRSLTVTGIIEDPPPQSHLQFDVVLATKGIRPRWAGSWSEGHMHTYVKIRPEASVSVVQTKVQQLFEKNSADKDEDTLTLQPLVGREGIHLAPPREVELSASGNSLHIQVLMSVALLILVIAGINYVNLATARSATRVKEIGVRKVVGAQKKTLVSQFLTESVVISVIAGVLAVIIVELALPAFNRLTLKELSFLGSENWLVFGYLFVAVGVFGIAAGIYPAVYLSSFAPTAVMGKWSKPTGMRLDLRKILVITQFTASVFLLVGMIVVQRQMDFVQSTELGFDDDHVIVISNFMPPNRDEQFVVRNEINALPSVTIGGFVESVIGTRDFGATGSISKLGSNAPPIASMAQLVDHRYLDVLGVRFKEGRNFSPEFPTDLTDGVIVNESTVRQMGIRQSAIGTRIVTHTGREKTIIGVVEDFHASSMHREITPFMFQYHNWGLQAVVKLNGTDLTETIDQVRGIWSKFVPDIPMDFYFLDDRIDAMYRADQSFQSLFSVMTGLALLIACLGLFGLATFNAERRTKEIAIRKALGAAVGDIIGLLSKDFARLVIIANLIAWPVAYIAMSRWLDGFAYRIDMGMGSLVLAGGLTLAIALATVCAQTLKVAQSNPVEALMWSE